MQLLLALGAFNYINYSSLLSFLLFLPKFEELRAISEEFLGLFPTGTFPVGSSLDFLGTLSTYENCFYVIAAVEFFGETGMADA